MHKKRLGTTGLRHQH